MIIIKYFNDIEDQQLIQVVSPYYIVQQEESIFLCSLVQDDDSFVRILGTYKDETRAKEVTKEIEQHIEYIYEEEQSRIGPERPYDSSIPRIIFTMPKE